MYASHFDDSSDSDAVPISPSRESASNPDSAQDGGVERQDNDNADETAANDSPDETTSSEISSVTFKCLGSVKQDSHQMALENVRDLLLSG